MKTANKKSKRGRPAIGDGLTPQQRWHMKKKYQSQLNRIPIKLKVIYDPENPVKKWRIDPTTVDTGKSVIKWPMVRGVFGQNGNPAAK